MALVTLPAQVMPLAESSSRPAMHRLVFRGALPPWTVMRLMGALNAAQDGQLKVRDPDCIPNEACRSCHPGKLTCTSPQGLTVTDLLERTLRQ